jgi:hypothetical protein
MQVAQQEVAMAEQMAGMEEVLVRLESRLHRLLPAATQALQQVAAEERRPEAAQLLAEAVELQRAGHLDEARRLLDDQDPRLALALQAAVAAFRELAPVLAEASRLLGVQKRQ